MSAYSNGACGEMIGIITSCQEGSNNLLYATFEGMWLMLIPL